MIFVSYNLLINFLKGVLFVSKTFDELHLTSAIKSVASLNKQMKKYYIYSILKINVIVVFFISIEDI